MRIPTATWLLALLFCYVHLCNRHVFVASALCLDDQRSLLLNFKRELGAVNASRKMITWNERIDCCQWGGVTCDHDGHVIGLDLSEESISAKVHNSSSLFGLRHLENLNLAYNDLLWPEVTSEFNRLSNLTYLNLSLAAYYGPRPVPIGISQLTRLVTLDISVYYDGFSVNADFSPEIRDLRKFLQNLTKIRQLNLDGVNVSAQGQEWTAALLQIPTLQELSMSGCNLFGPLQPSLAMLENLSVINIGSNLLSSVVPESYANFKNLTILSLSSCGLIGVFPHKIFQVPTLSFIDVSFNGDLHGSFPDFPMNGSLRTLSIVDTNFSGPLRNSIGNLRYLSSLHLDGSQFNGTLPDSFSNLTQLVEIKLSDNGFSGPIPSLAKCKRLQLVDLSYNNFNGAIPSTHFEGLMNLNEIDLHNNFFTGEIPSSVFMLPSLRLVDFSSNKFEGELNVSLKATLGMQSLDLSRNYLEGTIPISLFQIEQLDLSFNNFLGSIDWSVISKPVGLYTLALTGNNLSSMDATKMHPSFSLFPNLTRVYLDSCKLTIFPQFLKNQSEISILDLSNNHITGTIPHWISKLSNLQLLNISNNFLTNWEEPLLRNISSLDILDVHSNILCEPLPALPPNLTYLDYSRNNLSLVIPQNIGNYFLQIVFLSLSNNYLHRSIPQSICNASDLAFLDLSDNALTGTIPQCLITANNGTLIVLNLERNKLSGTIKAFPGFCGLRSLHLNGNFLRGKLPYLVNCTMLEVLDLGENQIEDQFPCWLQSIPTLRVLILRSNKLHGSLKCQGTHVGWPLLQIFDLSFNSFGGRIPPSFFETWKTMMVGENDETSRNLSQLDQGPPFEYFGYYQDTVIVTIKERNMELENIILTIITAIDLSHNKFQGSILADIGQMNALHALNLSHNAFSGHIPSSLGNLKNLESLDLSNNNLSGEIPTELASLSFLAFMNLSYNHLVGKIPTATQIQSFDAALFKGNYKLCGPPLTPNCSNPGVQGTSPVASNSISWNFIFAELGFASANGMIVFILVLHKAWRIWYWERVDNILCQIFPQLDFVIERRDGQCYRVLRWNAY